MPSAPPSAGPIAWPTGPTAPAVAELIRSLELTVNRKVDGILHGNYQGLTPGQGSEPGEARVYNPGDDVRRIDWNITARTQTTHVREQIADRDLEAWLVIDASAGMRFGTVRAQKAQVALAAAATVGFLTARNQNRVGAVLVAGPHVRVIPPRAGRQQVRAILQAAATPPETLGMGASALADGIDRVSAISRRRGFACVVSDFAVEGWSDALNRLGLRNELLVIAIHDRRERDLPPVGLVSFEDPATARQREVMVTPEVQRKFADRAEAKRAARVFAFRRAGANVIELGTDDDWIHSVVEHVHRRRTHKVGGTTVGARGRAQAATS